MLNRLKTSPLLSLLTVPMVLMGSAIGGQAGDLSLVRCARRMEGLS